VDRLVPSEVRGAEKVQDAPPDHRIRPSTGRTEPRGTLAGNPARSGGPRVGLILLPPATTVAELARDGLAPGLLSAGLGTVPAEQTYLDITQGNRVFDSLYSSDLPPLAGDCPSWWKSV